MDNSYFTDKVVLVTGSTSGLGLGIAKKFLINGAKVVINGINSSEEELMSNIDKSTQKNTFYFQADLSNIDEIESLFSNIRSSVGNIDILVNNAGIQHISPIESFPVDKWNQIIAVNLTACFHTIRLALPGMKSLNYGRIINICSAHALVGSVNKSAYVAAKHGLLGLTKAVALETAKTGVTCNAVSPGWVLTDLVKKQVDLIAKNEGIDTNSAEQKLLLEKQPSGKFVSIEQVSEMCLFIASHEAQEIRGSSFSIDGGWTAS
ncbi:MULTISPECIES: 3-hydroxybutyrate dehydrogenase [Candidatus Ichthyocystis]|uniref:Putative 3-hydroxybutyrate dehydrogenase n=1 Tax=Candidatus Ichthyocystis hellenicum TaxID=1561003 RepID=A0A0S4M6L4_9BURK|nr:MULTISPECIES: 3-hydroxybutyrate dehydrogenase [Ichthyocystis]CUT17910.1 putative 3-hydroxybutyrate dehydrogenase [Candidatus Ichthyocystis hellenicum]